VFEGPSLPENVVLAEIAYKGIDESFVLQVLEFCFSKNELGATMKELRVCILFLYCLVYHLKKNKKKTKKTFIYYV